MIKRKTINKIYLWLFVAASLAAFILFCLIYFIFTQAGAKVQKTQPAVDSRYYINEEYDEFDPYLTKVPDLNDMLLGPVITGLDPSIGSPNAPVVIVIFSDYLCSFCREQEAIIMDILEAYGDKVRLVFKDYPESDINSLSWKAAAGARCTGEQGAFIEYHDELYKNVNFGNDFILTLAKNLNLDMNQFQACLASSRTQAFIKDNIEEANALDINGIPFIYVNDQEVMGQASYEDLERLVEIELKKISNF